MSSPSWLDFYDTELRAHHEHLRAAYGISPGDQVVDIGCGTGLTTREAARAAAPGNVVGVDVSERMLERARRVTAAERLDNVRYELGDAQVQSTSAALASLSDGAAARAVERLRETLAAHDSGERGVVLDSRSWLITARRRR